MNARAQPFMWIGLQLLALWPHGQWYVQRITDGSDEPLGIVALAALCLLMAREAASLRSEPDLRWLAAAASLTILSTVSLWFWPPLLSAFVAALAVTAGLIAWLPPTVPRLPFAGLMVLALPLLSSLQFYAGYPLRLATAQLSAWVLQAGGMAAQRSGASMIVNGQLVIVDAPCSGVQMAWMAYFSAFAVAACSGVRDRKLLHRLPFVGLLVLAGNTLRNSILVTLEATGMASGEIVHQGAGVLVLGAVCLLVLWIVKQEKSHARFIPA